MQIETWGLSEGPSPAQQCQLSSKEALAHGAAVAVFGMPRGTPVMKNLNLRMAAAVQN